jgi:hypothetical protein
MALSPQLRLQAAGFHLYRDRRAGGELAASPACHL